ncbi:MAG: hypothetical protein AB1Z98_31415 [Nannocystaceae bacterium]
MTACSGDRVGVGGGGGGSGDSTGTGSASDASGGTVAMTSVADDTGTGGSGVDSTVSTSMGTASAGTDSTGSSGPATATDTDSGSSSSTGGPGVCGDDVAGGAEACDGSDLAGEDCASQGFDGGTIACANDCSSFDTTGCFLCGDDVAEGTEACDGSDLAGQTCVTQGFDSGMLACQVDCAAFETSMCVAYSGDCCAANGSPGCDDGACTAAICAADPSCCGFGWDAGCAAAADLEPACPGGGGGWPGGGHDMIEGIEVCDGTDLAGQDCTSLGFDVGTLACQGDCSALDTSSCVDFTGDCCGANGTPGCDDGACTTAICAADPDCCGVSWDAACAAAAVTEPACQEVGGSCPACGDDVTEGLEVCDGTDVGGQDCTGLGFDGGTLGCQPDCSALDSSTCQNIGFGDCLSSPPGVACLPQEQCITDLAVPPTQGVCTDPLCTSVADCPLAPPGGTAPVQCIDVTGEGINECILFCGLPGSSCPPGMICALGIACAWPAP